MPHQKHGPSIMNGSDHLKVPQHRKEYSHSSMSNVDVYVTRRKVKNELGKRRAEINGFEELREFLPPTRYPSISSLHHFTIIIC
ncbi:21026_t:CDS:2 [Cetraspora pellucida]|uniref:21026_t:CDS:1 n=1 Tax=Cetraspora pellucida TaxID=1433469 RepID=A0A9N9D987_9GLOM|nr:21026_t:CDS:2 [Cetraspora pellucida]